LNAAGHYHSSPPLFGSGGFDGLDIRQAIPQESATKPHWLNVFSPGDGMRANVPARCNLLAGEKANKNLLTDG
jgi:hypothetical protein